MPPKIYRGFHIKYVDGFKIRNTLDDDFGVIHRRSSRLGRFAPKFYIPSRELWIDYRYKAEARFLLAVEFFGERHKAASAMDYQSERAFMKEQLCAKGSPPNFVTQKKMSDGLTIYYVDGRMVRQYLDPEFILGGHDLVYSYVPARHIWLDMRMDTRELPYILEHEKVERALMQKGKSYDVAHEYATVADKELRRRGGAGRYPGDANYPWQGWADKKIIRAYYVR